MKNYRKFTILLTITLATIFLSCSNAEKSCSAGSVKKVGKYSYRQDSELTLLMRNIEADFKRMRTDLKAGKKAKPQLDYQKILHSHSTDPEVAESESFKAFASSFLQTLNEFEHSEGEKANQLYKTLINTCMSCHESHCPGPTMRIKKLY